MEEKWKKIENFPDYEISNYGNVKSFKKEKYIILKQSISSGFKYVTLHKDKKSYHMKIHILVLENFKSKRPVKKLANHIDGNKINNKINNLEWITKREIIINAIKRGKGVLSKKEIIDHFYKNKALCSNNYYNIKYKYELKKINDIKEKIKFKIIIDVVKKYNCNLNISAKMLNVSREWVRQVITKCGYIVVKYLVINGEICGQKIMAGKGKVR